MKTVLDYLTDPRITNDPILMMESDEMRLLRAIHLKLQDETKDMMLAEEIAFRKKRVAKAFSELGLPLPQYVNFDQKSK